MEARLLTCEYDVRSTLLTFFYLIHYPHPSLPALSPIISEEAERVSELKGASGTGKLPYGTLADGSQGIKDAINTFDDARKVDIENERLPPDLVDADEAGPASPADGARASPVSGEDELPSTPSSPGGTPISPASPSSPGGATTSSHRRGHSRTSSLGTTMSSPSNRRRSLESTISMIKEALDGGDGDSAVSTPLRLMFDMEKRYSN